MVLPLTSNIGHGSTCERCVFAFALGIVTWLYAGCDGQTGGGSQRPGAGSGSSSVAQRQADEYDRQMAVAQRHQEETDRQIAETNRQLAESDRNLREAGAQSKRYDELQERWSSQADRVDALLLRWEKLTDAMEQRVQEKP